MDTSPSLSKVSILPYNSRYLLRIFTVNLHYQESRRARRSRSAGLFRSLPVAIRAIRRRPRCTHLLPSSDTVQPCHRPCSAARPCTYCNVALAHRWLASVSSCNEGLACRPGLKLFSSPYARLCRRRAGVPLTGCWMRMQPRTFAWRRRACMRVAHTRYRILEWPRRARRYFDQMCT